MLASATALPFDVVGDMGVYPVFSPVVVCVVSDGMAETGVRVDSAAFPQLASLDAVDEARVACGGGHRFGI
jgi:hypothetical protein